MKNENKKQVENINNSNEKLLLSDVSGSKKCRHTRKKHFTPTWCKIINEGCSGCSYYR